MSAQEDEGHALSLILHCESEDPSSLRPLSASSQEEGRPPYPNGSQNALLPQEKRAQSREARTRAPFGRESSSGGFSPSLRCGEESTGLLLAI